MMPLDSATPVDVSVAWGSAPLRTTSTAATVEVDVMPHLARVKEGGSFDGYFSAVQNLDAAFVRYSPWFAYPGVVVPELYPADCSANGKGSSWNSTLLDQIYSDFMLAQCGPEAAKGECWHGRSVVPQISTMPAWLYADNGVNRTAQIPKDPWQFPSGKFDFYLVKHTPLKDPTCTAMAQYAARYVGWYTNGGFVDECGVQHISGLHYDWPLLSVLNEDEYGTPPEGGVIYTICWDAWKREIAKINPRMKLVGPETAGGTHGSLRGGGGARGADMRTRPQAKEQRSEYLTRLRGQLDYSRYFLNGSHHADGQPPPYISNHVAMYGGGGHFDGLFTGVDDWVHYVAEPLDQARKLMAPQSELIMNEFIPFMSDWCNVTISPPPAGACNWALNGSKATRINRQTLGWNAAAASFAYGYARLAMMGFKYVGNDQLVGGVWPDNEPAVASLDWRTGEPNAKYYVVQLLAATFGSGPKRLLNTTVSTVRSHATPGESKKGNCGPTNFGGDCSSDLTGAWNTTTESIKTIDGCVAKCRAGCSMCNYVSFSLKWEDCSWYTHCEMDRLVHGFNHSSVAVEPQRDIKRPLYALGIQMGAADDGKRYILLISKVGTPTVARLAGAKGAQATVLDGSGLEPGFQPPRSDRVGKEDGTLPLGPFAVAVVQLDFTEGGATRAAS